MQEDKAGGGDVEGEAPESSKQQDGREDGELKGLGDIGGNKENAQAHADIE